VKTPRADVADEPAQLGIYDLPLLYDLAFSYRDFVEEADVLLRWYRRSSSRQSPRAILEIAAGPGRHAIELAKRGLVTYTIDGSAAMCEFAYEQARVSGVNLKVHRGDLFDFEVGRRFDLALLLLDSASHIPTAGDMAKHLASVARHMYRSGIYIVELAQPKAPRCPAKTKSGWVVRRGNAELRVQWRPTFKVPPSCRYTCDVRIDGTVDGHRVAAADRLRLRSWSCKAFERGVRESGHFRVAGLAGGYNDAPYEPSTAWRQIYILQRT
jgi:SAM-dependent methyltransferase